VAAVKLHLPLAHLEAGLRSFNRRMPEEHNRVLTDHAADLCLAPTALAVQNLEREGLAPRARLVGDVMADVCLETLANLSPELQAWADERAGSVVATIHRADNTDDPDRLKAIITALQELDRPVILPVHPRLRDRCRTFGLEMEQGSIRTCEPLAYRQLVALVSRADAVITDSGGLQKEAFLMRVPCITVRSETEWPETLVGGWNVLSPRARDLAEQLRRAPVGDDPGSPFGNGQAAAAVCDVLVAEI
jgi:UDP-N-acetylglucosamine 2-epimerase (non-hydrolysing)